MNEKFFINGRCYKTPCKTVLTADTFTVKLFTDKHTIIANVTDRCYFVSIDNISLYDIKKNDFHFSRKYTKPKEFLSNLYDTLNSFLNTSLPDNEKCTVYKSTDEVIERILEIVTATDPETSDIEDPEKGEFDYDVSIHNDYGWDTYTVRADGLKSAEYKAVRRMELETESADQDETAIKTETAYKGEKNSMLDNIRPVFYFIEHISEINVDRFCVDVMCDYVYIGYCAMYIQYSENDIVKKALCKSLHIHSDFRECGVENTFLRMLANKYNGLFCVPVNDDDYKIYSKIADECKKPSVFVNYLEPGEKCFFISPDKNNKKSTINSMYGITANTTPEINNKHDETKEQLAVEQFERLTGTLYKSLFKAIGLEETRRIPIIISNNMVFFNYNGMQYKYNPSQCKVYKKDGRKYQRINWKYFTDDNSPDDQKQARGRSPPLLLI